MAPLAAADSTKFMTPSEPDCAIWVPVRGKYSVITAPPGLNGPQMDGNRLAMYRVNIAVEPEPSEWTTGMIVSDGSLRPLLSAVISGSFQLVILLVKILASVCPDSRRFLTSLPPTLTW